MVLLQTVVKNMKCNNSQAKPIQAELVTVSLKPPSLRHKYIVPQGLEPHFPLVNKNHGLSKVFIWLKCNHLPPPMFHGKKKHARSSTAEYEQIWKVRFNQLE